MAATSIPTTPLPRRPSGSVGGLILRTQSDRRLVGLCRAGSAAAFEEIVRRYRAPLLRYAATISPPDRADDVVQDALTKAFRALGADGEDVEEPRAWLYQVVRNTALNDLRAHRHPHEQLDESYDGVEQPPQAVERREELAALLAGLNGLPPAQRAAIVKRELEGLGHRQIAAQMSLSAGAVRQLIYRARRSLRDGLGALLPIPAIRWLADRWVEAGAAGAGAAGTGIGGATLLKGGVAVVAVGASLLAGAQLRSQLGGTPAEATHQPGKASHAAARPERPSGPASTPGQRPAGPGDTRSNSSGESGHGSSGGSPGPPGGGSGSSGGSHLSGSSALVPGAGSGSGPSSGPGPGPSGGSTNSGSGGGSGGATSGEGTGDGGSTSSGEGGATEISGGSDGGETTTVAGGGGSLESDDGSATSSIGPATSSSGPD